MNVKNAINQIRLAVSLSRLTDDELTQVEARASAMHTNAVRKRTSQRTRQTTQRITVQRGRVWQVIDTAPLGEPIVLGTSDGRKWRVTRER